MDEVPEDIPARLPDPATIEAGIERRFLASRFRRRASMTSIGAIPAR